MMGFSVFSFHHSIILGNSRLFLCLGLFPFRFHKPEKRSFWEALTWFFITQSIYLTKLFSSLYYVQIIWRVWHVKCRLSWRPFTSTGRRRATMNHGICWWAVTVRWASWSPYYSQLCFEWVSRKADFTSFEWIRWVMVLFWCSGHRDEQIVWLRWTS